MVLFRMFINLMSYRWITLFIVVLIEGLSGLGRSASFSPFLKDIVADLSVTMVQISFAYGIANLCSGIALPYIGKAYDRWPVADFLRVFIIGFGGAFITLGLLAYIKPLPLFSIILMTCAFIVIRMGVQTYMLTVRCMVGSWFVNRKEFAIGITTFLLASIASLMPWLSVQAHKHVVWYHFWLVFGICWVVCMSFLVKWVRKPDAPLIKKAVQSVSTDRTFLTKPAFWIVVMALFFKAFQNTGFAFHLIPICQEYGTSKEQVTRMLALTPLFTVTTVFIMERFRRAPAVALFLLMDVALLKTTPYITHSYGIVLFGVLCGIYWGIRQIIAYVVVPKLFGVQCIGAVNGWISAAVCLGSATGPYFMARIHAVHSYHLAIVILQAISIVLLFIWILFRHCFDEQKAE